jgi:hypothetical protein
VHTRRVCAGQWELRDLLVEEISRHTNQDGKCQIIAEQSLALILASQRGLHAGKHQGAQDGDQRLK